MSYWDLQQWIESRIPAWLIVVVVVAAVVYLAWMWFEARPR